MSRSKKPQEAVTGSYTPVMHALLDSAAFMGASDRAKAMLFELLRQHNGRNNGHLQLSVAWLKRRGWKSADQIQKAKTELLDRGLVVKTRLGGLSIGPDWFALTWLPVSDYEGLDIRRGTYQPGQWRLMDPLPLAKNRTAHSGTRNDEERDSHSGSRNRAVPGHGIDEASPVPSHGTKSGISGPSTVPPHGNNECCQLPTGESGSRVVGKPRRSGVRVPGGMTRGGAKPFGLPASQ